MMSYSKQRDIQWLWVHLLKLDMGHDWSIHGQNWRLWVGCSMHK